MMLLYTRSRILHNAQMTARGILYHSCSEHTYSASYDKMDITRALTPPGQQLESSEWYGATRSV